MKHFNQYILEYLPISKLDKIDHNEDFLDYIYDAIIDKSKIMDLCNFITDESDFKELSIPVTKVSDIKDHILCAVRNNSGVCAVLIYIDDCSYGLIRELLIPVYKFKKPMIPWITEVMSYEDTKLYVIPDEIKPILLKTLSNIAKL